jgi:HEAT repeat protein
LTLCYGDNDRGVPTLVEALGGDDEQAVEAASWVLLELICRGALPEDEAFERVRRLSQHIDPAVRRNAVRAIVVFEEKAAMVEVLDAALADSDPEVAAAAEEARRTLDRAG